MYLKCLLNYWLLNWMSIQFEQHLYINYNNYFEICDGKRTVVYGLDKDSKLKGQKWRIYFWWNIAADRIQLIHSY